MCTILVAWRAVPGAPLIVAANRDELRSRPSAPPGVLDAGPPVIQGGRDLLAGGTWLAVSADGRLAAVTNRRVGSRDPDRRSRGELPMLLLADADPVARLDRLDPEAYNAANVIWATADVLAVRHLEHGADGPLWLGPGAHVLTTVDVDDASVDPLRERLALAVDAHATAGADAVRTAMEALLGWHGGDSAPAVCMHGDTYGSVSSASVTLLEGGGVRYRAATGQPCTATWDEVAWPAAP